MKSLITGLAFASVLAAAGPAAAHVGIASGPAAANKSQKITFSVGHGCTGADTIGLRVEIPAGVTSVRAFTGDLGKPTIEGTAAAVTAVSWRKPVAETLDADFGYYEVTIRARVADVPFTRIHFLVHQTCRAADGTETNVDWTALPGEQGNEAPALIVVPSRQAGWNTYTLGASASVLAADLPTYFGDALIVWKGTSAYSANPSTAALIAGTTGVTPLASDLAAGEQIWVRY